MRDVHGNDIVPKNLSLPLALPPILKAAVITFLLRSVFVCLATLGGTLQNVLVHDYLLQEALGYLSQNEVDDVLHFEDWLSLHVLEVDLVVLGLSYQ
jgi:hypothetical protein